MKGLAELPVNQYRAALQRTRLEAVIKDISYRKLVAYRVELEANLKKEFPQLNVSNEDLVGGRREAHVRLSRSDPSFVKLQYEISQAWRTRAEYLLTAEPRLVQLEKMVKERKRK